MKMVSISSFIISMIFVCLLSAQLFHADDDINCLKSVKASLDKNNSFLKSWDFTNGTKTNVSTFSGIECWNPDDNRVLSINLSGLGLVGQFPLSVSKCGSMTGLDLSNNNLNGSIPSNISHLIPYVTSLDLSYNLFSGNITDNIANCTFMNILKLNNNNFTGQIPEQIGQLTRLKKFDVSNNQLSGRVPDFGNNTDSVAVNYANNAGLCGGPLSPCKH
ncbi:hypothetical protein CASFOL_005650 [Castilleja foliolosa]|uniref:Leucine-rich repeat-containing N-terminal plant-type domain-containing protein n=1 Tax=Castilleja foliolosa TaxID=1961234 RepID=A0ABD3E579_9LAMI